MASTDYLDLSHHQFFKEYRNYALSKRNDNDKSCSLVVVKDSVLFTWDFKNNCVVSLNIKGAKQKTEDSVSYQKLLPTHTPLFTPEFLVISENGDFLAVAGPHGVLVLQLPSQVPPHGNFGSNKDLVCCRSYSLDERLLACSDSILVKQTRFLPGSNNHILVLTSDNMLRLYRIDEREAPSMGTYQVGDQLESKFAGIRITDTEIYGETAIDFDFGNPVITKMSCDVDSSYSGTPALEQSLVKLETSRSNLKIIPSNSFEQNTNQEQKLNITWPIYILRENFTVYTMTIDINSRSKPVLRGPLVMSGYPHKDSYDASSLICLNTTPQIIVIANEAGILTHCVSLELDKISQETVRSQSDSIMTVPDMELIVIEVVELEMALTKLPAPEQKYKCHLMLHKDESKISRYFATHAAGLHSIDIDYVEDLLGYIASPEDTQPTSDIFINPSTSEYLICTKTSTKSLSSPIIGFSLYLSPPSIITLLGDGNIVTLAMVTTPLVVPKVDDNEDEIVVGSPLKKMLNEPFKEYIQKILKKGASRPLLKLTSNSGDAMNECIELLNQATRMFCEEQFSNHTNAREELGKRANTLRLLKIAQNHEINKLNLSKEELRREAEQLAERYEDIKDKHEELIKRIDRAAMLASGRLFENPQAQREFMEEMQKYKRQCVLYQIRIDKLKSKNDYQKQQIQNWKALQNKKNPVLGESQGTFIMRGIQDMNKEIDSMLKQITTIKDTLQDA